MSWFSRWRRKPITISRGLLIPYDPPLPATVSGTSSRVLMVRPAMALVATGCLLVVVYSQANRFVEARLTQPASAVVVAQQSWPYQIDTITEGPNTAFGEETYFQSVVKQLVSSTSTVVTIDTSREQLTVYQSGRIILEAVYSDQAVGDSWRTVPAGYYTINTIKPERYSSLEQAYYTNVLELNQRMAIHGPAVLNSGSETQAASLGFTLGASDAVSVAALVEPGTPVVVHVPTNQGNSSSLTPRGPRLPVRSYLAVDVATGDTLASAATERVVPIASLTKLMTALVVVEEYDLESEILVEQEQYVTTLISRLPGTRQTTIYDLLQLLLLESSNEAAEVLATHMGRDTFIAEMNARAAALGLANTTFTDPSGLDNGNVSTAADLVTLAQYLHETYPFLISMSATEATVAAARTSDFTELDNFNAIDGLNTFVGGKIGETEAARQTSLTFHELPVAGGSRLVIIAVLGTEARNDDVRALHNYLAERYGE
jgi:D-alanyl-D-alanine carboxypeptidase